MRQARSRARGRRPIGRWGRVISGLGLAVGALLLGGGTGPQGSTDQDDGPARDAPAQRVFRKELVAREEFETLHEQLAVAMGRGDVAAVVDVVAGLRDLLGEQAGLPDERRPGLRAQPRPLHEPDVVTLFLEALESERSSVCRIEAGKEFGDNMLRVYAQVARGCCAVRPAVVRLAPQRLSRIDRLVRGACAIMVRHQQADGHFPFPDLRGKHDRFGPMIERLAAGHEDAVQEGWVVAIDPQGGAQFDTGECGVALLEAGRIYGEDGWRAAGLRAARWARGRPCVPNWNYNAFSVSLLARAFIATGDGAFLEAAHDKFALGVAPGQLVSGRWIDPHNARTVYHVILLRAAHDLWEAERTAEEAGAAEPEDGETQAEQVARRAVAGLVEEIDAVGLTVFSGALAELVRHRALCRASGRTVEPSLAAAIDTAGAAIVKRCTAGGRPRMAASLTEIAALLDLCKKKS